MKKTHFDLSRKIIAATTSDGWQNVPHFAAVYETEADLLADVIGEFNSEHPDEHITMNSAILRVIVEGIKAAPVMNSHIEYDPRLVNGTVTQLDHPGQNDGSNLSSHGEQIHEGYPEDNQWIQRKGEKD